MEIPDPEVRVVEVSFFQATVGSLNVFATQEKVTWAPRTAL
jgi:hypothetical protein